MIRVIAFFVLTAAAAVVVSVWFLSDDDDGGSKVNRSDRPADRPPGAGGPSALPRGLLENGDDRREAPRHADRPLVGAGV